MGSYMCKRVPEERILIQGLDAAGKTSLLYKMKLGEVVTTIPTIGFNVETVRIKGVDITCWDLGGRDKIRPLYRHYYQNTSGFVLVIDSSDHERLDEAIEEFIKHALMEEETKEALCLVLANKQDLEGALPCEEIEKRFLDKYPTPKDRKILFRPCSVVTGDGIYEAFEDFISELSQKRSNNAHEAKTGGQEVTETAGQDNYLKQFIKKPMSFFKSLLFY